MAVAERIVIIGGGLTAARAVEQLRAEGFDGEVLVATAEGRPPYERPPLSKGYLLGTDDPASTIPLTKRWYREHEVELRTDAAATALDVAAHAVTIGADAVAYDRLLLATGARPRRFTGPGAELTGVHTLRTLPDSTRLRTALKDGGRRVVLMGAGWIGLEVAAAARGYGNEVTVVAPGEVPLASAVGPEVGAVFARLHEQHGVVLRMGAAVTAVRGRRRVDGVILGTGEELDADLVVVGIGAVPNTELAASAGLTIDDGIVTDSGFRTSAPDVFAAGDVANVRHPVLERHLRVEHWANAENQGRAVGRVLAGADLVYDEIPYFFTDQYDLGMEYSGYGPLAADASVVFRGDVAGREFLAFWVRDHRVVAGMNVNVWDVNETVQTLIRTGATVDPEMLRDPAVPLESLIPV
ncbi:3-phenylpropionate/trans-cinnamate dioxygenase ferredoxin reductase subunit [Agromyces terreus]|uniref:3-phenylpropionate/trans-cinnamate dioxygenase ferredoxin reductase subunit n=1 Tax=Agromyces terreus TaxID=424795 RepID=A0A9X2H4L9_9MICO|nr:FAD-dependent oxidoreductase [Agromyces terreus]MCP2369329.1 3-phenylpropionate/trans-cinnamate dioxygenase ferredoxin reductase subunit [Agromyces terreus]